MSVELSLLIILAATFIGILSGVPIGYVFGVSCLVLLLISGNASGLLWVVPAALQLMQGFAFLAIPMYLLLGTVMQSSGLSVRLFAFAHSMLGRAGGAFGSAVVAVTAVFGAMSGSASAAIAALGPLVIPEGHKYGYHREHITALVAAASLVAMLIPPSITMIMFGVAGKLSIALLFLATAIPGIITTIFFIGVNLVLLRRWGLISSGRVFATTNRQKLRKGIAAWPTLAIPLIVLGGIYGGVFTPTEAAVVAVAWVLLYSLVASVQSAIKQKSISEFGAGLAGLGKGFIEAGRLIGALVVITFFMFMLSRAMIWCNVSEVLVTFFGAVIPTKYIFLAAVNIILIVMGMAMDDISGCILAGIFLLPIATHFGVNPLHFGAIVGVNLGLGNLTPPVAPLLYLAAGIGDVPVKIFPPNIYTKAVFWLLVFGQLPVLVLVTYIPEISLFLPNLYMG